jgi:tetratricopeptide (TPR) repeat protein
MTEHSFSVGEKVRVMCDVHKLSRRGMIACHNLDMTYDIIYDNKSEFCKDLLDEEPSVAESRISSLLDFEIDSTAVPAPSPCEMKEYGNILYKIRDYDSAIKCYRTSLDSLFPVKLVRHQ